MTQGKLQMTDQALRAPKLTHRALNGAAKSPFLIRRSSFAILSLSHAQ
jgi:hypothetical protein